MQTTQNPRADHRAGSHRRVAARLVGLAAAGALVATVAVAPPALAAGPAVSVQTQAQTTFDGGSSCPIVSGGNKMGTTTVTVPTTGTKSVSTSASGSATAQNSGDVTDTAVMKATNKIAGSFTGTNGAFSKAAFTVTQSGTMSLAKGFGTACDATVSMTSAFLISLTVKRTGKLTVRLDLPRHVTTQMQLSRAGGAMSIDVSVDTRGKYAIARRVKPGDYQAVVLVQSGFGINGTSTRVVQDAAVGFSATYVRS